MGLRSGFNLNRRHSSWQWGWVGSVVVFIVVPSSVVVAAFLLNFYAILLTGSIISIACSVNRRRRDAEASSMAALVKPPTHKNPSKHTTPNNFLVKLTPYCADLERGREKERERASKVWKSRVSVIAPRVLPLFGTLRKQLLSHLLEPHKLHRLYSTYKFISNEGVG